MTSHDNDFWLHLRQVGELYHPGVQSWPEISRYNYRNGEHDLVLFLNKPSEKEIHAARTGGGEFALLATDGVIMLCHRFGDGLPWSDSPFTQWFVPPAERRLPTVLVGRQRALLFVSLVDASTGILLTLRVVSLSPEFTVALHDAIRRQARTAFRGREDHEKRVARIFRRYPTTEALVAAATVRCTGGADDPEPPEDVATSTGRRTVYVFGERVEDRGWVAEDAPDAVDDEAQLDLPGRTIVLSERSAARAEAGGVIRQKTIAVGDGSLRVWVVAPAFYHPYMGLQILDDEGEE